MARDAIVVQNLGKQLRRHREHAPRTFQAALASGLLRRPRADDTFWALRNVSFAVAPGRSVGLVGHNGAGKSTLLRLLGGIGRPDEGQVAVRGRIGALLDLGAGLHPDLSGRENTYVNGAISGLTRREIGKRFDAIVDFAELEAVIDSPLRTYSSGMQMRLAFAIAVHTHPEVLMIDEVLAVGDMAFQQKCLDQIEKFKRTGCTIVVVSHDADLVERFCDEALWLRQGKVAAHGPARDVMLQYTSAARREMEDARRESDEPSPVVPARLGSPDEDSPDSSAPRELVVNKNRFGSQEMQITDVRFQNALGQPTAVIHSGESLSIELDWRSEQPIASPIFGVAFTQAEGPVCCELSLETAALPSNVFLGTGTVRIHFARLDLTEGLYTVDVGIYKRGWAYSYDDHRDRYHLHVRHLEKQGVSGILCPPHRWEPLPTT